MINSLPVHKVAGVREAIEAAGATLRYLPKYLWISIQSSRLQKTQGASTKGSSSEPYRVSRAKSALLHSARKNQATLPRDRNPLYDTHSAIL